MNVRVDWLALLDDDEEWHWTACLYAYQHPTQRTILYIGKTDGTTVRSRLYGRHKNEFFRWLKQRYGSTRIRVLQGEVLLGHGQRLSRELLNDIESLLINQLKPLGNIAATRTRISRPGLRVRCTRDWPYDTKVYVDE